MATFVPAPFFTVDGGVPSRGFPGLHIFDRIADATAVANKYATPGGDFSFYWEIGDQNGPLASGSIGPTVYTRTTTMSIASATKWLTAIYALETYVMQDADWQFLNFTSGYVGMLGQCQTTDTVASCLATDGYDTLYPAYVGKFFYGSGHMEHFGANQLGLGPDANAGLATAYNAALGTGAGIGFTQPLLAGGAVTTPAVYAGVLQRLLAGGYVMSQHFNDHMVPAAEGIGAANSPVPADQNWWYGVGHWREPDGAWSSPGKRGFCPWIEPSLRWYGIVAQDRVSSQPGDIDMQSVTIAQAIRAAWLGT